MFVATVQHISPLDTYLQVRSHTHNDYNTGAIYCWRQSATVSNDQQLLECIRLEEVQKNASLGFHSLVENHCPLGKLALKQEWNGHVPPPPPSTHQIQMYDNNVMIQVPLLIHTTDDYCIITT